MGLLWVCAALACAGSATQPPAISLPEYLRRNQFTQKDLEAIVRGGAVAKLIEVEEKTETRILGVVKIRGNPEDYVARQRDVVNFERGTGVIQIGLFRDPASAADLDGLTLDEEDFEDLKNCRPGECDIKLSDSSIEAFRTVEKAIEPWIARPQTKLP